MAIAAVAIAAAIADLAAAPAGSLETELARQVEVRLTVFGVQAAWR